LVHFGRVPEELNRKAAACARVDAEFITSTRPGRTLGQIFQRGVDAYRDNGYADEWKLHHQGGLAGYEPREQFGVPGSGVMAALGQAYAWNPSIKGVKSEDTILVGAEENEVITTTPALPTLHVDVQGKTLMRPAILEII
jgi:antitoxin VapB